MKKVTPNQQFGLFRDLGLKMPLTWFQGVSVLLIACNIHDIETACQPDCAWVGWSYSNECTTSCSGTSRIKSRLLCCYEYETFDTCARRCGRQNVDSVFFDGCNAECNNGGTYFNNQCNCVDGTTTRCCGEEIDECDSNPCLNRAKCEDAGNSYRCVCAPGYAGSRCETDLDECDSYPCLNQAKCEDGANSYRCHCTPGYTGTRCQTDKNTAATMGIDGVMYAIGFGLFSVLVNGCYGTA